MWLLDLAVAVGPVIGYWWQLRTIEERKAVGAFSIDICGILMVSAILRVFYWLIHGFAFNLLIQAILIFVIQVYAWFDFRHCCQRSVPSLNLTPNRHNAFGDGVHLPNTVQHVIKVVKFLSVVITVVTFTTVASTIIWIPFYATSLGFLSLTIQATLGVPQLISNYQRGSVEGLSFLMIATWLFGDFFKTLYFIIYLQPLPFIMCGCIQIAVDLLIILQIINYKEVQYENVKSPEQEIET